MLKEKAMLVSLHIACWTARKHDKNVSNEVAENKEASSEAGRYSKHLLTKSAEKLEELNKLGAEIREYFYSCTLPWNDEGYRVLASSNYFDFNSQMNNFTQSFKGLVQEFFAAYPRYRDEARVVLGKLYDLDDYPDAVKLMKKFDVKIEFEPMSTGEDFRVNLGNDEQNRIAREIDAQYKRKVDRGMSELWNRLQVAVLRLANTLEKPKSKFFNTTIPNVAEVARMVPKLNIVNDEGLNTLAQDALDRLATMDRQYLVDHPAARALAAGVANDVASKIARAMRERGYDVDTTTTLAEQAMAEEAAAILAAQEEEDTFHVPPTFQSAIPGLHIVEPPALVATTTTPSVDSIVDKMSAFMEFAEAS